MSQRTFSWQFWKSTSSEGVDPWPANVTNKTSESLSIDNTAINTSASVVPPSLSSSETSSKPLIEADEFGYIPEPPPIPSDIPIDFYLNAAGEPALATLGLGKWYLPTGWIQQGLDLIHANIGLPWWATIMIGKL